MQETFPSIFPSIWRKHSADSSNWHAGKLLAAGTGGKRFLCCITLAFLLALSQSGIADDKAGDALIRFDIPRQRADLALTLFAEQANLTLIFPYDVVRTKNANRLVGEYSVQEGAEILLQGTGLRPSFRNQLVLNIAVVEHAAVEGDEMKVEKQGLGAVLASIFLASGAGALGSVDDDVGDIEEIVVTASKREQKLQDVPLAIVVVDPGEYTQTGLGALRDVLTYTPGFSFNDDIDGAPGAGSVTVRGVSQGVGITSVVGVYLDDIPLTDNGPWANAASRAFDGMLGDIERVELLKGPQGTLYGATAIGGAIKYVTRLPSLNAVRGHTGIGLSSTTDGDLNRTYDGRVSFPLIQDRVGVTVASFYDEAGGFIDRVAPATSDVVAENVDAFERTGYSGDLYIAATDQLDFRLRVLTQDIESDGLANIDLVPGTTDPRYGGFASDAAEALQAYEVSAYSGTLKFDFGGTTLVATTSLVEDERLVTQDFSHLAPFVDLLEGNPAGTTTSVPLIARIGGEKIAQEFRLTSKDSETLEWLVGLYHSGEETFNAQSAIGQPTSFDLLTSEILSDYEEYAAFGNVTYYFSRTMDLTVGTRLSSIDVVYENIGSGALFGGGASSSFDSTVDTWLLAGRYRPSENTSLYARVASGFRPPFSSVPLVDPTSGFEFPDAVESDQLWSYEVGVKGRSADSQLTYEVTAYYLDWKNFQTVFIAPFGVARGNAFGGIAAKGVEGSILYESTEGLSLSGSVAYTDSELEEDEFYLGGKRGEQVPNVPELSASVQARYEFSLLPEVDAFVGMGLRYQSGRSTAFDDALDIDTDDFLLTDFNLGAKIGRLSTTFYATNLSDERVIATALQTNFGGVPDANGTPLRPRTIGLSLSLDF